MIRRDVVAGLCGRLDRFLSVRVNQPLIMERAFGAWRTRTACVNLNVNTLKGKAEPSPGKKNDNGNAGSGSSDFECSPVPVHVLDEAKASYANLKDQRRSSASSKHRERMLAVFGGAGGAGADSEECMLCEGLSVSCAMCRVRSRKNMRAGKMVVD